MVVVLVHVLLPVAVVAGVVGVVASGQGTAPVAAAVALLGVLPPFSESTREQPALAQAVDGLEHLD